MYNILLGYNISGGAKIGFLTVISVKSFTSKENLRTGMFNLFKGPIDIVIGKGARIGRFNRFTCSKHVLDERFNSRKYNPRLTLGANTLILNEHFFDVYGEVTVGDGSWIAGHGSQFWTHGLSVMDRDIHIGNGNYIGSGVRFAPGTSLGNENIVSLGSVVVSKLTCSSSLVSGFPAKPIRCIAEEKKLGKYRFSFEDWQN